MLLFIQFAVPDKSTSPSGAAAASDRIKTKKIQVDLFTDYKLMITEHNSSQ
jgi:hypothetical protein